jgi:DNA-binding MarR family transcriptional regulator
MAEPGRFAYAGLDRVLHEKARLGLLVSLLGRPEGLTFVELKQLCSLTDGNLSRHLDVLADEALVAIVKGQDGRRPRTTVRMTEAGRRRFLAYLAELERVVRDALPGEEAAPRLAPG